jgi:hypothetical protein
MLNFLRGLPEVGKCAISKEFLQDVRWWRLFLIDYNGVSMIKLQDWSQPDEVFQSDACLSGCGAMAENGCFHVEYPSFIVQQKLHINSLELLAIIASIKIWSHSWRGKCIVVNCDNKVAVEVINAGRTKNRFLQACLREIVWWAARNEFELKACHIAGISNRAADSLSRWHLHPKYSHLFKQEFGHLQLEEIEVEPSAFAFSHDW